MSKLFELKDVSPALLGQPLPYGHPGERARQSALTMCANKSSTRTAHKRRCSLGSRLNSMQRQGILCDLILLCDGGNIPIHSSVLAIQSDLFKALLLSPTRDTELCTLDLKNVPVATMQKLIGFIYTGAIEFENDISDVFNAASELLLKTSKLRRPAGLGLNMSEKLVFEMYRLGSASDHPEVSKFAFEYLLENITSLTTIDLFLEYVEPTVVYNLLKHDNLAVPSEDCAFEFLDAWFNKNRNARIEHMPSLKKLIRFPFLTLRTIKRLKELEGALEDLPALENAAKWDLKQSVFRHRRHERIHCHLVWQEHRKFQPPGSLLLTCGALGERHDVLVKSAANWPKVYGLAMKGHTMCLNAGGQNILTVNPSADSTFSSYRLNKLQCPRADLERLKCGLHKLHQSIDGDLYLTVEKEHITSLYRFEGVESLVRAGDMNSSRSRLCGSYLIEVDNGSASCINVDTGDEQLVRTGPSMAENDTMCVNGSQRGDTIFLCYSTRDTREQFIDTLNVTTGKWGDRVQLNSSVDCWGSQLQTMRGGLYNLRNRFTGSKSTLSIDRLDEGQCNFKRVQDLELPYCFVGMSPSEVGPSCPRETWLQAQIRKLPDSSKQERAVIEELRRLLF